VNVADKENGNGRFRFFLMRGGRLEALRKGSASDQEKAQQSDPPFSDDAGSRGCKIVLHGHSVTAAHFNMGLS